MKHHDIPLLDVLLGTGDASRGGAPEPTILPHLVPFAPVSSLGFLCGLGDHFASPRQVFPPWPALGGAVLEAVADRVARLEHPEQVFEGPDAYPAALVEWFMPHGSVNDATRAVRTRLSRLSPSGPGATDVEELAQRSMIWLPLAVDCRSPGSTSNADLAQRAADALYHEIQGRWGDVARAVVLIHFLPFQSSAEREEAARSALELLSADGMYPPWLMALAISRLACAGTPRVQDALAGLVSRLAESWTTEVSGMLSRPLADAPFADVLLAHPGAERLSRLDGAAKEALARELEPRVPALLSAVIHGWGGAGPPKRRRGAKRAKPPIRGAETVQRGGIDGPPPPPPPAARAPAPEPGGAAPPEPGTSAEQLAGMVPRDAQSPKPESASQPSESGTEPVDAAVFSPPKVAQACTFLVQVLLYPPASAATAEEMARRADATAERRGTYSLPLDLNYGTRVDVRLEMPSLTVEGPDAFITWRGNIAPLQFEVSVPGSAAEGNAIGRVRFAIDGVPAGTMRFQVTVVRAGTATGAPEPLEVKARRYRSAFVSYASADRAEVLRRVQAFKIAGLEVFQDVLSLEPGERWEKGLYKAIDTCDVFLLFWSHAAQVSKWVDKEIDYALARKQGDEERPPDIQPVPIEGPPIVVPPAKLGHLHFNDALLAHIKAATPPPPPPPLPAAPRRASRTRAGRAQSS